MIKKCSDAMCSLPFKGKKTFKKVKYEKISGFEGEYLEKFVSMKHLKIINN